MSPETITWRCKKKKNGEYIKARKSLASGIAGGSQLSIFSLTPLLFLLLLPSPCRVFPSLSSLFPHPLLRLPSLWIGLSALIFFYDFFSPGEGLSPLEELPLQPIYTCHTPCPVCVFECATGVLEDEGYPKHKQGTGEAFTGPLTITVTVYTFQRRQEEEIRACRLPC